MRLSDSGLRRARARSQLLHGRAVRRDVAEVVAHVVGVQAQEARAAALSVRARSSDLVVADVDTALAETRSVVLTWSLRGTRHFHHRADARWIVGLLGPVFGRPGRRAERLGIGGQIGETAVRALGEALAAEGPLTRTEVKRRLEPLGVDPTGQAAIHVIRRAALERILFVVPDAGGEERYVFADHWLPPAEPIPPEDAAAELARRHLGAFGPATVEDFAAWSGLGSAATRAAWAVVAPEVTEVQTSKGPAWVLADDAERARAGARRPAAVRLLGGFDSLLLGYAERGLLVAPEHARRVNAGGGMVKATVLADGEVVGTWGRRRQVELDLFRPLTKGESAGLDAEVADVERFLSRR